MTYSVYTIHVNTTGGAGVSAGTGTVGIPMGMLAAIAVDFSSGQPAGTCDITVSCKMPDATTKTLLSRTNTATDIALHTPTEPLYTTAGVAVANTEHPNLQRIFVGGMISAVIAQGNDATDAAIVTVVIEH